MCGICGIVYTNPEERPSLDLLVRMSSVIAHRGPDDQGIGLLGQAGLGMRRLSIIDLQTGHQPITNEEETVWVVFNGEIYNFPELRASLLKRDHNFKTASDTETIVHAYEEWGENCVEHLNGMFAFALWDVRRRLLLLARDRIGKKPLYYALDPRRLVFGSELKCLLQAGIEQQVDLHSLYHYLTLQYVPGPDTILADVHKLPPAHVLIWKAGDVTLRPYWHIDYRTKLELSCQEWIERVRYELTESVRRRLISDVPLGAFLSGGVDSSIIVALMAQLSNRPVRTFSIGFDVEAFNETNFARQVAGRFATDHQEFNISFGDVASTLPSLVWHLDEPMADSSALATYHLARLARQHVTVALNGDGGDEAFAGYTRYVLDRALAAYICLPSFVRRNVVPWVASRLAARPDMPIEKNVVAAVQRLRQASETSTKASIVAWGSYFSHALKAWLCNPSLIEAVGNVNTADILATYYDRAPATTHLDRTLYADFMLYLPDDLMVKADRMTMAHSLEGRSPYLDYLVVELMASMPERFKIRGFTQKWILRQAFAELLPPQNVRRVKRGFSVPVAMWFRGQLRDLVCDVVLSSKALGRGYFRPEAVRALVEEHVRGQTDHGYRLWTLLMLELWHRQYVDTIWPLPAVTSSDVRVYSLAEC